MKRILSFIVCAIVAFSMVTVSANESIGEIDVPLTRAEAVRLVVDMRGYELPASAQITAPDSADVPEWAVAHIVAAIGEGIIKGYEDGTIRANNIITRAELVAVIVRAMNATSEYKGSGFSDVTDDMWYAKEAACAKVAGVVEPYEDGTFRGDSSATREDAIIFIHKAKSLLDALQ